jgi:putative phage-type endonuclease
MPLTREQLEFRRGKVTASNLPAILGIDPYGRTVHDVYREMIDGSEKEETIPMRVGNMLEPLCLSLIAERGKLALRTGSTITDPERPWLAATPDAESLGLGKLPLVVDAAVEAKAPGLRALRHWGDDDTDQIPEYVAVQCTAQMIVTRTRKCYVGAILGTEFRYYEVGYSDALANAIIEGADRFYYNHLKPRFMPAPDGSDNASAMIASIYREIKISGLHKATEQETQIALRIFQRRADIAVLAKDQKKDEQDLRVLMGDKQTIYGATPDGKWWRQMSAEREAIVVQAYDKAAYRHYDLRVVKNEPKGTDE